MKSKESLIRILFNTLKIWGAGWLGALFALIPYNVGKFFTNENLKIEYIILVVATTIFAAIALIFMSYREWYKERVSVSTRTILFHSIAPALVHMLLCIISFGNTYILMIPKYFTAILANMEVDAINLGHVFLTTLIFNPIYALALFLGGIAGQKKRVKDRKTLCENPMDNKE